MPVLLTLGGTFNSSIDRMSGDIVWSDRSWLASGDAIWRNSSGRDSPVTWLVDYDQNTDSIYWTIGGNVAQFDDISLSDSPLQMRYSVPENKLLLVVRRRVIFGNRLRISAGSYLKAE